MKSPFTFKRYWLTASAVSAIAFVPGLWLLWRSQDPMWLALPVALVLGLCLPLNVWFVGEIAWRGARSSRLHDIPFRNTLIRLAAGLGLILLSRYIPTVMWEFDEDMIAGVLVLAGWIMTIYAIGQLIGIGMKRRDRTKECSLQNDPRERGPFCG